MIKPPSEIFPAGTDFLSKSQPVGFPGVNMPIEVLLVEDNEADARLLREVLQEANSNVRLHVVSDGVEALEFLRYQGRFLEAPRPDIVLLDLNLPKMSGFEVLINVKQDPRLRTIPCIVLTSSRAEADVLMSYQLLANCVLSKPLELEEFQRLVANLNEFWLTRFKLPKVQPSHVRLEDRRRPAGGDED